ncbi:MAG: hypothetical protein ACOZQL_09250 [Myxococcota bacterium]
MSGVSMWVVCSLLAAGEVGVESSEVVTAREAPRFHAAIGAEGTIGATGYVVGGGPGLAGELGLTLVDRTTLALRVSFGVLNFRAAATAGVGFDYALSDRWSLGAGARLGYVGAFLAEDVPNAWVAQVPVRAQFALWTRGERQVSRSGLRVTLEAGPGYVLLGSGGLQVMEGGRTELPRWAVLGGIGLAWCF